MKPLKSNLKKECKNYIKFSRINQIENEKKKKFKDNYINTVNGSVLIIFTSVSLPGQSLKPQ